MKHLLLRQLIAPSPVKRKSITLKFQKLFKKEGRERNMGAIKGKIINPSKAETSSSKEYFHHA